MYKYLKKYNNVTLSDISFKEEESIYSSMTLDLNDNFKFLPNNYTCLREMFSNCSLLSSLSGISKWNTNNVIDMSEMFYRCNSLTKLPGISK